jgi:acyl transferase domain-containing protein/thioesterase domain-containing protein/acyl carrier protein
MKELAENSAGSFIAITGMAGRFPGARNIAEFWRNLRDGVESISLLSDEQLRAAGVAPADLANPDYVRAAAILDDVELFDGAFFGFSRKDAAIMDPQHRHFLECAWEALENAGWCPDRFGGRIGVYAGSGLNSYLIHNLLNNPELVASTGLFLLKQTGNDKDVLATRVSYQLNLTGPSLAVQTACSTSLVAVHLACQSLLNHECDMALAGGVTIEVPHGVGYVYREGEILSRDGHCRAFDADSSGTIFGSGLGIVVLRRLEDALRDGDFIRAVIRGTAINNDGARKVGYLAPSVAGQSEAIAEALAVAGVGADSVSYVECHGTGTTVGDPIEIKALTNAFRESTEEKSFCAIGSVKTNIGHLDAAAGVAGLIKTVLALEHRQLPPTLNFSKPNALIDFEASPFFPNSKLRQWQAGESPRRAGVTALGIGGTNAHVILEEAPAPAASGDSRPFQLITLSAKTESALGATLRNLAEYLAGDPGKLADVAYTWHLGRKEFALRRAIVCSDIADAIDTIRRRDPKKIISNSASDSDRAVMFLFPGQGSQFVDMGADLYRTEAEFRSVIDFCADFLQPHIGLDLRVILFPAEDKAEEAGRLLNQTRLTQPALFVIEFGLTKLWLNWGIQPKAMIGHSIGEFTAACVAGVFSLETALRLVAERGRLIQSMAAGAMSAVSLPEKEISALLGNGLSLAAVNSEDQCVVSGPDASLGELEAALSAKGVACRRLRVSHAFHSGMMDPILKTFEEFVRNFELEVPRIPYVSCVTGSWITDTEATDPSYWARQLRESVRFSRGVGELLKDPDALLLEIGPGNTLSALTAQHNNFSDTHELVSSLRGRAEAVSDAETLIRALARLWAAGKRINWQAFHSHERRQRLPLPSYPFERQRFWIDPGHRNRSAESRPDDSKRDEGESVGLFRPAWKRSDLATDPDSGATGPWLIFRDSEGLGAWIAESLGRSGEQCVVVTPGESFRRISDDEFQIIAGNPADYVTLVSALSSERRAPRSIVHLWAVTTRNPVEQPLDALPQAETLGFYSLLFLSQALAAAELDEQIRIGIVSNSLHQVADEPVMHFERALLMGPCGVIPQEFPDIRCRNIDVVIPVAYPSANGHVGEGLREAANQILCELRSSVNDSPVAYRSGRRWTRIFVPAQNGANGKAITLREGGVYLITGGLGGIGLVLAESMARRTQSRFVLIGRNIFPPRCDWEEWLGSHGVSDPIALKIRKIRSIEALGSEVFIVAADTADLEAMRRVAAQTHAQFGAINGIIHAAGVLDDAPILEKDASSAARVLAPKVRGTLVLKSVFAEEPLEFFILLSSISSTVSPAGQIDYAAANAFLDAFAGAAKMGEKCQAIAIQWPRWRDVGMAAVGLENRNRGLVHPLLQQDVSDNRFDIGYFTKLNLERDWIVGEHRLKSGSGLFPGTGYIEMARAALAARFGQQTVRIQDFFINVPLKVEAGVEQPVWILLRKEGDIYRLSIATKGDDAQADWIECAQGKVSVEDPAPPPTFDLEQIRKRCNQGELKFDFVNQNQTQGRYIDFGPRWRNLKQIYLGRGEALSGVELAPEFASDIVNYRVHPAILDMATGAAMFLIGGYSQIEFLYVPVSYGNITLRGPLPAKCYAHLRIKRGATADSRVATFDITILDELGHALLEIEDLSFRQIRDPAILDRARVQVGHATSPPTNWESPRESVEVRDRYPNSISSTQGVRAFEAILGNAFASKIVVFPSDLVAFLEKPQPGPRRSKPSSYVSTGELLPKDEIELTLAGWWEELLGVQGVSTKEDFFQLGGDSLTAARFFAKVNKKYGIKLSLATIFAAPTIERLARIVRNDDRAPAFSSIVPIQPLGSKPPLFVVHGLGGEVLLYRDLVKYLGNDQPVYGVQSPAFTDTKRVLLRLEDLAAHYVEEIRTIQPKGPYCLLGHSLGGVVGFEIAQQLRAAGQEVGLLGMLDTWEKGYLSRLERELTFRQALEKQAERWSLHARAALFGSRRLSYIGQKLFARARWLRIDLKSRALGLVYAAFRATGLRLPRILDRPEDINGFVYGRYKPRPYPGRVVQFRAEKGVAAIDSRYGYALGWEDLAEAGTEVYEVPGTHTGLLQEPNVRVLAEKVTACLTACHQPEPKRQHAGGTGKVVLVPPDESKGSAIDPRREVPTF